MRQFIDRAIYPTEHRFFPSWTHTLSEECVVVRIVVVASPILSIVRPSMKTSRLLLVILSLVVDDVEEAELVNTLGGGNDAEPVTELLLLEELLSAAQC